MNRAILLVVVGATTTALLGEESASAQARLFDGANRYVGDGARYDGLGNLVAHETPTGTAAVVTDDREIPRVMFVSESGAGAPLHYSYGPEGMVSAHVGEESTYFLQGLGGQQQGAQHSGGVERYFADAFGNARGKGGPTGASAGYRLASGETWLLARNLVGAGVFDRRDPRVQGPPEGADLLKPARRHAYAYVSGGSPLTRIDRWGTEEECMTEAECFEQFELRLGGGLAVRSDGMAARVRGRAGRFVDGLVNEFRKARSPLTGLTFAELFGIEPRAGGSGVYHHLGSLGGGLAGEALCGLMMPGTGMTTTGSGPGPGWLLSASEYAELVNRQTAGEILDLGGVPRPAIGTVQLKGGTPRVSIAQGTGRWDKTPVNSTLDVFVPSGSELPSDARVLQRAVPASVVHDANLLSSRGAAGANPVFLDLITSRSAEWDLVRLPRRGVLAPMADPDLPHW